MSITPAGRVVRQAAVREGSGTGPDLDWVQDGPGTDLAAAAESSAPGSPSAQATADPKVLAWLGLR